VEEKTQKKIEIRIIISYYSIFILILFNLINLFEEKLHAFLSYIILNHRIEAGKKETENNLKNSVIYLSNIFQ